MVSIKVKLNKGRTKDNDTYPLVFQLIYRREKRLIYSPYRFSEKEFDEKKERIVISNRKRKDFASRVNKEIKETIEKLLLIVDILNTQQIEYTTLDIVNCYKASINNSILTTYFKYQIQLLKNENRIGTANAYSSTLNCLYRFLGDDTFLSFKDINEKWISEFIYFLRKSDLKTNSINFYLRILRAVYNKACYENIEGALVQSPFKVVSLNRAKTQKRAVDKSILQKIGHASFSDEPHKEFAKDLFLFSFYCRGMPFIDIAYLKEENIKNGYINYYRHKTGSLLKVKIMSPAQKLIKKYKGTGEFVFPILKKSKQPLYEQYKNQLRQYNRQLRAISEQLHLPVSLSSYVSRHSWATLARESGVSVSIISEGMGHSSEKITYTYLASLHPSHIDDANEKIIRNCLLL